MPGMTSTTLPPFSAALTPEMVEQSKTSLPAAYITGTLITLAAHLIDLASNSTLFGKATSPDASTPSLQTLQTRLLTGSFGPSLLPAELLQASHIQSRVLARYEGDIAERPLADFEDLYYAVLAALKETAGYLHDHVRSGFHSPSSTICDGGDTISALHAGLCAYWALLNSAACGKALDDAVRQARFEALREDVLARAETGEMECGDAEAQIDGLLRLRAEGAIDGMVFIGAWAPGMISVTLQQRYAAVMGMQKAIADDEAMRARRAKKMESAPKKVHKKTLSRLEGRRNSRRERQGVKQNRSHSRKYSFADIAAHTSDWVKDTRSLQYGGVVDGPVIPDENDEAAHFELDRQLREMDLGSEHTSEAMRHQSLEWDMMKLRVDEYQEWLRETVDGEEE